MSHHDIVRVVDCEDEHLNDSGSNFSQFHTDDLSETDSDVPSTDALSPIVTDLQCFFSFPWVLRWS